MTPIRETIARAVERYMRLPEEADEIWDEVSRALDAAGLAVVPKEASAEMLAAVAPLASGKPSPEAMAQAGAVLEDLRAPITWNAYIGIAQLADDYRAMIAAAPDGGPK